MLAVFEIGGSRMRAAASPAPGRVDALAEVATPTGDFAGFVAAMSGLIPRGARGVAVSVAGVADPVTGRMTCANIPAIHGRALVADLTAALGLPVVAANDADCFALAEAVAGAGVGHRVVMGIIIGTGLGGGIVVDGRILPGAGEWGHGPVLGAPVLGAAIPVLPCPCGQAGCAETLGSARGIERLHAHLTGVALDAPAIARGATRTLEVWAAMLAGPLAMLMNTLGPSAVPVGGGLGRAPGIAERLDVAVRARMLRDPGPGLIRRAQVPGEPGLHGAAALGWDTFGG
ncbi:MAG TPA: ROK family protein [Paracoccaceae bacterium]|nr:ROK family protein [Paracoccaceae bacterium]